MTQVIDSIANALGARLKLDGFRKQARTWRRRVDDAIQVVNVQGSMFGATLAGLHYRFGRFYGYWPPANQAAVMGAFAYEFVVP
jgi:hypothetical protein